jgi:hypothetical protein
MEKKVIKVSAKQLKTIIAEEASKYKKVLELQKKKDVIMSQLNEMYAPEEIDEIFGLEKTKLGQAVGMQTPEQKTAIATQLIQSHPAYKQTAANVAAKYKLDVNMVFQKLVQFVVNNGNKLPTGGLSWDNIKQLFVDNTKYTGTAPGMQGGA